MEFKVLVDGKLLTSDKKLAIINPSTQQPAGYVPEFDAKQIVDQAMQAANNAFSNWKNTSFEKRKSYLMTFHDLLLAHKEELADILTLEIAKSKKESLVEIERSAEYIADTIEIYEQMVNNPLFIDESVHNIKGKVGKFIYEPLGVVLAISPFNYPVNLLISKLAPALISGNTVVYKPATQGSLSGAKISELLLAANFPAGVVNCVVGNGREIGDLLVTNPFVSMISFTGSANVGNHIAKLAHKIPLVLEMGGKDPAIVLEDCDLELTANEIVKGALSYNGQRCTAIKRVFVPSSIHHELVKLIVEKTQKLTVGMPQENTNITPVISDKSADYIMGLVDNALSLGAKAETNVVRDKNLIHPIILDYVTTKMNIAWEEPFGPVLPIIEYKNIEECVNWCNQSEYGLQASIFTKNISMAESIALQLDCGSVNINRSSSRGPDIFPFLGTKNSGFGVQGLKDAILSMTRVKGIIYNN